jgi:peptidoglycan hydrolase-like protein with peptidoglycan-binding domain
MWYTFYMKKIILVAICISTFMSVSAQSAPICTDLSLNLMRGSESKHVLALQNFLFAKGILKATPNGYFGPATLAAVKAYQKSLGLSQVGNTGPATRAAIKKESCNPFAMMAQAVKNATTTTQVPATTSTNTPTVVQPAFIQPILDSVDPVTLFAGGETDWTFDIHGTNFSPTSNLVQFKNMLNGRIYSIGILPSPDGKTITLPKNVTATTFTCGTTCKESLSAGRYEVSVTVFFGGQSNTKILDIQSFTITAQTDAVSAAIPASVTNAKFGSLTFSPSRPVIVRSVTLNTLSSSISAGGISGSTLKDEIRGSTFEVNTYLNEFQSMLIGAYVSTNNVTPGTVTANFSVEVEDYIGKKRTKFTSPSFFVTVAGVL